MSISVFSPYLNLIFFFFLVFVCCWVIGFSYIFSMLLCCAAESRLIISKPLDCSLPSSSVFRIFQTKILEWIAIFSFSGSFLPRDWTCIYCVSCIAGKFFTTESSGKPVYVCAHVPIYVCVLDMWPADISWLELLRFFIHTIVSFANKDHINSSFMI